MGVLGQTSWTGTAAGAGLNQLEGPRDCFYDETNNILFVTEWSNSRVSIYEDFLNSFTTATGSALDGVGADYAQLTSTYILGVTDTTTTDDSHFSNPNYLWYDGTKVYVTDPTKNRLMIFDYPVASSPSATMVLGQPDFATVTAGTTQVLLSSPRGVVVIGNKIYVSEFGNRRIVMWDAPGGDGESMTSQKGQYDWTTTVYESGSALPNDQLLGMDTDGDRLFTVDYNRGRVLWIPAF